MSDESVPMSAGFRRLLGLFNGKRDSAALLTEFPHLDSKDLTLWTLELLRQGFIAPKDKLAAEEAAFSLTTEMSPHMALPAPGAHGIAQDTGAMIDSITADVSRSINPATSAATEKKLARTARLAVIESVTSYKSVEGAGFFIYPDAAQGLPADARTCIATHDAAQAKLLTLLIKHAGGAPEPVESREALLALLRSHTRAHVLFLDADLDGRLDLFENNGHLEEDIKVVQASQQYEQPPHLLWNCGTEFDNEFIMLPEAKTGADFQKRMVGRGAAMADIDADGDLDLILFSSGGKPRLLRNDQKSGHHWLRLRLRGTKCNKDAIGAVVNVTLPNSTVLSRTVMPTRSYQSQTELPVTFGLGSAELVKEIAIRWPDGTSQKLSGISVDQQLEVIQEP